MSPRRSPPSLKRPTSTRSVRQRILIVCEGEVTEVDYFTGIRDYFRSLPVEIRDCRVIGLGCDPLSVVEHAVKLRNEKRREARSQRDVNIDYDEVWCVVDVDDHATLDRALITARREQVNLVVSMPCFDLWILFHYQEYTAGTHVKEVENKLKRHIPGYDKHLPKDFPYERHDVAAQRAKRADPEHTAVNRKGGNPSTNVWLAVEAVRKAGRPAAK